MVAALLAARLDFKNSYVILAAVPFWAWQQCSAGVVA